MITPRYLIGFTGHRAGYNEAVIRPALRAALVSLQTQATNIGGQAELVCSIAEGSDTLVVELGHELGMPVHVILPLPEDDFATDFSTPSAWQRAKAQIDLCRQSPSPDSVRVLAERAPRPDCYMDQGMFMLESIDVLLALWDGKPARGPGGTAGVIADAKTLGKARLILDSTTGQVRPESDADCTFIRDPLIKELTHLGELAKVSCATTPGTADQLEHCLDKVAIDSANRFRPSLVRIILMHGLAALLATIVTFEHPAAAWKAVWDQKWFLTFTELLLVSYALFISYHLHRKHTREQWITARFACELVRGLRRSVPLLDPLRPSIAVHDPAWLRFARSVCLLVHQHLLPATLMQHRDTYLKTRLGIDATDPVCQRESQILHYRTKRPRAQAWWTFTGYVSDYSAILAPPFVLISLLNKLMHWGLESHPGGWFLVSFLPIALPLIAGVANGIRHALDAGRRKERYPEMEQRLTALRTHLTLCSTPATISNAVTETEEILLDELREWQLTARNTGH